MKTKEQITKRLMEIDTDLKKMYAVQHRVVGMDEVEDALELEKRRLTAKLNRKI